MATTKTWSIKSGHLGKVIDYVSNSMKTDEHNFGERKLRDLYNALHYVQDSNKSLTGEKHLLVSGVNCDPSNAKAEWVETKKRWRKEGGILAHHAYQSFKPGEVTPELAHKIGVELAEKMWGDRFEVIVATHLNAGTIHNHLLCNSVSFTDGKKYNGCKENYLKFRALSDNLCRQYELSVIENPGPSKKLSYPEYTAQKRNKVTKYDIVRFDIDDCLRMAVSIREFRQLMEERGYTFSRPQKYLYLHHPNFPKGRRLINLGAGYSEAELYEKFQNKWMLKSRPFRMQVPYRNYAFQYDSWQTLYVKEIKVLDIVRNDPYRNLDMYRIMADEIRKFEKRVEQQNLMLDHDLYSDNDVRSYRKECAEEIGAVTEARQRFRNVLRRAERAGDAKQMSECKDSIQLMSDRLELLRKHIRICDSILNDAPVIEEKIGQIKERAALQEQQRNPYYRKREEDYER